MDPNNQQPNQNSPQTSPAPPTQPPAAGIDNLSSLGMADEPIQRPVQTAPTANIYPDPTAPHIQASPSVSDTSSQPTPSKKKPVIIIVVIIILILAAGCYFAWRFLGNAGGSLPLTTSGLTNEETAGPTPGSYKMQYSIPKSWQKVSAGRYEKTVKGQVASLINVDGMELDSHVLYTPQLVDNLRTSLSAQPPTTTILQQDFINVEMPCDSSSTPTGTATPFNPSNKGTYVGLVNETGKCVHNGTNVVFHSRTIMENGGLFRYDIIIATSEGDWEVNQNIYQSILDGFNVVPN